MQMECFTSEWTTATAAAAAVAEYSGACSLAYFFVSCAVALCTCPRVCRFGGQSGMTDRGRMLSIGTSHAGTAAWTTPAIPTGAPAVQMTEVAMVTIPRSGHLD